MSDISGPDREGLKQDVARVNRLEWITIAYLASSIAVLVIVMSGSQALKTEFIGDALSMIAPALVLIGGRISARAPSEDFPFGYERAVSAGYLGAALALLAVGVYLFVDSGIKLVSAEHPIIGGMRLFGQVVWIGWLAIPALLWSAVPAFLLGRAKQKLAEKIYDKVLLSDAETNAANWKSASAAMLGILGVAAGLWWADAAAAFFISLEIAKSGWDEVTNATGDIVDRRPRKLGSFELDPLPEKLTRFFRQQPWIKDAVVRVRDRGREFVAEALIVPRDDADLSARIDGLSREACRQDDRLRHVGIMPLREIPDEFEAIRADQPEA